MRITYHGHSTFVVEHDGHRVAIDPFLSGNPLAVAKPEDIEVEAILLTHAHADHVADVETIAQKNNATVVAVFELASWFGSKGLNVHPMHLGGSHVFPFGRVKYTLAFHGAGIETPDGIFYGGNPGGILLTMGDKTFYHAGDTALFGDMKLIGELNRIDVAALPIGDNFTMGPEDALIAAEWVRARKVIPIHYNTFDLIRQDPEAFVKGLAEKGIEGVALKPGETLEI
ncbi:MAG: metal-dependent hydrolase [Thermoflavifilum sp.]|nr:metal-dependent hydrolase [Thermoflavifilum sp.]MCL6513055.1 metal-dependent hydrolase [Alicyclobacillus sp.]